MRLIFATLVLATTLSATESTQLVSSAPSRLVLEGTSNVAAWRCSGTTLDAQMEVGSSLDHIDAVIRNVEEFTLSVPVITLRCGNRQMERDMTRALRSDRHPSIDFEFAAVAGAVHHGASLDHWNARIEGVLTLAGTRRDVSIDVEAERISPDRFLLRARLPLRMTDFDIRPPTALFGMIRADDRLVVQFDLVLRRSTGVSRP